MAKLKSKDDKVIPEEIQKFIDIRKRPAVVFFLSDSLALRHVVQLRGLLRTKSFDELDIIINSGGGSINAAYQIIQLLRLHTKKLTACVPFLAKSAATLICIGADEIILDELSQLGPLDTQIYEEKKGGKGEYNSALNPFKTLEQLQKFSIETLDIAVKMVLARSGLDLEDSLKYAIEFVGVTTGPLFSKLDPDKLGEYTRALAVGTEYGQRILKRFKKWDNNKIDNVLEKLVHGYPSHDYIIDYNELNEIGFEAKLFNENEENASSALFPLILRDQDYVDLVCPNNEELCKEKEDEK